MPINVNDVKTAVELRTLKDQKTTYLQASKFNIYAKDATLEIVNEQRLMFESGKISSDNLSDLKVKTVFNIDPTTGQLTKPTELLYSDSFYKQSFFQNKQGDEFETNTPIEWVTDGQLATRLNSQVNPPTKERPIVVEYDTYYQFYPFTVGLVTGVYLRQPADPVWGFTTSSGFQVYDSGTSTNFDLPYQLRNDVINKICEYVATSLRQADLYQISKQG